MIEFGSKSAGAEWILRLDDDEFPSRNLLSWLAAATSDESFDAYAISRRDVSRRGGGYFYSRWPSRWTLGADYVFNPQPRLHRAHRVTYIEKVHSSGFVIPEPHGLAPGGAFFVHCNNLLRSPTERLAKVRKYATYDEPLSWNAPTNPCPS